MGIGVTIDKSNFSILLDLNELSESLSNELRYLVMNRWDTVAFHRTEIRIPYYQFKRSLPSIVDWTLRKKVRLNFDEDSNKLIISFARDRRGFRGEHLKLENEREGIKEILKKEGFKRTLTENQLDDTLTLYKLYNGANFSVPGAGKTTTLLALFTLLKAENTVNKLFVVSPINAFISWETEIEEIFEKRLSTSRLTKSLISNYSGVNFPDTDVYLSNYEKYRDNIEGLSQIFFNSNIHLVLDESHRIKSGFQNQSFPQLLQLGDCARRRDIMSGTPMPQSYVDIESQFEFLWPTERVIPRNTDRSDLAHLIQENIQSLYVRTTKDDLNLQPINYISTEVEMGPVQRQLYDLLRSESVRILARLERDELNTFRFLGRSVVRLMQASSNPMLLTSNEDIYDDIEGIPESSEVWELLEEYGRYEKPAKFLRLEKRVKEILSNGRDTKVLIWSVFVRNINLLGKIFEKYNPAIIYGGVASSGDDKIEESREGQIRKFHQDDSCKVMIANPQACGEGISLHRVCHHAIYLERNYNAAHYLQSMDRIHRLGLEEGTITNIELLIANNSLDQRIDSRLRIKIAAMSEVLNDQFLETLAYDPYDIIDETTSGLSADDIDNIKKYLSE
ncbi:MAG: DEAD/DEAH box helicase [Bacteroidota bacterium]